MNLDEMRCHGENIGAAWETSHRGCIMRKVVRKAVTAGGRFDFFWKTGLPQNWHRVKKRALILCTSHARFLLFPCASSAPVLKTSFAIFFARENRSGAFTII